MSRLDKQRRKELLREVKRKEMADAFAAPSTECRIAIVVQHARRQAAYGRLRSYAPSDDPHLRERSLPEDAVLQWLDNNGGFCDCEILANSEQAWEACKDFDPES